MGLAFYDENQVVYPSTGNPLEQGDFRSFHDGHLGEIFEKVIYLRNDDPSRYFTNLVLSYTIDAYGDFGEFGSTGWGIKFMYGQRRPTEAEWDLVRSNGPLALPDIGNTLIADTSTYHPIWIRIVCPGAQAAQIRENQKLKLTLFERLVGA